MKTNLKHLPRIIIWLVILVTPTALWFAFSDDGQDAWQMISKTETKTKPAPIKNIQTDNGKRILIPAIQQTTKIKPRLRISISANNTDIKFPFNVNVMDNKNHETGIKNNSLKEYNQIVNSKINYSNSKLLVDIHPATSLIYTVNIMGNPGGSFRLAIGGISPTLESSTIIQDGYVANNRTLSYKIDLSKVRSLRFGSRNQQTNNVVFISNPEVSVTHFKTISLEDTCKNIYKKLTTVPNGTVETSKEKKCSYIFNGKNRSKSFVSPEELFYPYDNSQASADGWTADREADGPDGGSFRIKSNTVFCNVSGSWDGGVDDDPKYIPGEEYSIRISCDDIKNMSDEGM